MHNEDFTTSFLPDQTPMEVSKAVNDVRGWWTENIVGSTDQLNDEFEVRFGDVHYSRQQLVELVPGKRVSWLITDSQLSFVNNKNEWTNTQIHFEITGQGDQIELRFTHQGLVPAEECFNACSNAWTGYINNSLQNLITTGTGNPTRENS